MSTKKVRPIPRQWLIYGYYTGLVLSNSATEVWDEKRTRLVYRFYGKEPKQRDIDVVANRLKRLGEKRPRVYTCLLTPGPSRRVR